MKRIISFFLLAILLVTAIPITATASAVMPTEEVRALKTDYDKLYVKDGLIALYTAFDASEAASVVSTQRWENKLDATGATDATVFETVDGTWTMGEKAGFGYTWALADYSKSTLKAAINLPASYASMDDFFVEASYAFHPLTDSSSVNYYANLAGIRLEYMAAVAFPSYSTVYATNAHCIRWVLTGSGTLSHGSKGDGTTLLSSGNVGSRYLMYWDVAAQNAYRTNANVAAGLTHYLSKVTNTENAVQGSTAAYVTYDITYNTGRNDGSVYSIPAKVTYDQYCGMKLNDSKVGHFSFFNNFPAEAYAIRVYDRVLSEEEKQHNHLIDLLAFYQVTLPEHIENNPALLDASLGRTFFATPFVSDSNGKGFDYGSVKQSLEDEIAALTICTVTARVETQETLIPVVQGETLALFVPAVEEKTVLAWRIGDATVAPDATISVTADTVAEAVAIPYIKTAEEIAVRVVTENADGEAYETPLASVRFTAEIDRAALDAYTSSGAITVLEQGMLITPKAYVEAAGAFTAEALEAYVKRYAIDGTRAYIRVRSDGYFSIDELSYTIAGGFGNFSQVTKEKDPYFAAVAYLDVDYNGDGRTDTTIYGLYEESKTVRVSQALLAALRVLPSTDPKFNAIKQAYTAFCNVPSLEDSLRIEAPMLGLQKGTASTVVWAPVLGAKGYVVTVNGVAYPEQTECSFTLPTDGSYTVTVRAIAYDAAYNSPSSQPLTVEYGFNHEDVVLRFASIADVHIGNATGAKKLSDIMAKTYQLYDVDAFLFAGDLTNAQNSNKKATVTQMALFASYAASANATEKVPLVWTMGNHDFPTYQLESDTTVTMSGKSYTFLTGTTAYDAAITLLDDASDYFFSDDAWPVAGDVPDGFRYNVINGFSFVSVDYTFVTEDTMAWLDAQLSAMASAEPTKQIFLMSHMPSNSSAQPAALTDLLKAHPQVVYISGHTHVPLQNYSGIAEREGFVELIMGPGNHAVYGVSVSDSDYNSYQMKQGVIVEVDSRGNMRVRALDYSFTENEDGSITSTLDQSYVVAEDPMVIRTAIFTPPSATARAEKLYDSVVSSKNDDRYFAPYIPEESKAAFTEFSVTGGRVTFTAAKAANVIRYYNLQLVDMTTGLTVSLYDPLGEKYAEIYSTPSYYIYYPSSAHMPDTLTVTLLPETALDVTHSYSLRVYGVDDFGNATKVCAYAFAVTGET
ncbi:MAG: metallophosphoesterase, partial [Clostridia bacterium]|nr:metallophosphoesterase [Clostridia bacterium]